MVPGRRYAAAEPGRIAEHRNKRKVLRARHHANVRAQMLLRRARWARALPCFARIGFMIDCFLASSSWKGIQGVMHTSSARLLTSAPPRVMALVPTAGAMFRDSARTSSLKTARGAPRQDIGHHLAVGGRRICMGGCSPPHKKRPR
eukprot:362542-Chlamydomonas_euryale.AAC.2